jgi:hypothetical protein
MKVLFKLVLIILLGAPVVTIPSGEQQGGTTNVPPTSVTR